MDQFLDNLLVVIVLYRKTPDQSTAYTSMRSLFRDPGSPPEIFIYDNSPEACASPHHSVTYVHSRTNAGTSAAYNSAALHAGELGKQWLLFLDQDTAVTSDFFDLLGQATRRHPEAAVFVPRMKDKRGIVSPFRFSCGKGRRLKRTDEKLPLDGFRFINSGLTIRRSAFVEAGGYDENIPLDFSDISFGDRLKVVTDHFVVVDAELPHNFSDDERISVDAALARFVFFCRGASAMGRNSGRPVLYSLHSFLRACRLSVRYKDFRFLNHYLQHLSNG